MKSKLELAVFKSPPEDLKKEFSDYACVSLILRTSPNGHELAFIRRAHNPNDHWAGHVAFPGGRREPHDADDIETALRETREEVGWELNQQHFVGFLTDIRARNRTGFLDFFLRPLVFFIEGEWPLNKISPEEVDEVFWINLEHLTDHKNKTSINIATRGMDLPGIQFPTGDILWGLTYMITRELLSKLEPQ